MSELQCITFLLKEKCVTILNIDTPFSFSSIFNYRYAVQKGFRFLSEFKYDMEGHLHSSKSD